MRWLPCLALAVAGACSDPPGPDVPPVISVNMTVVGDLRYTDGSPVVGATIYKYQTPFSSNEASTHSDVNGHYSLSFLDHCIEGSYGSGVGITPPVAHPTGGTCTGEILCQAGTQRRDCTFSLF